MAFKLARGFSADAKALDELRKPKFSSKYLINHVSSKLIPAVKEWEKAYQPPVIHLGRVLSVGDGIARIYGLKSVQVSTASLFSSICFARSEVTVTSRNRPVSWCALTVGSREWP
jgi:F-type H+-transporting ATPase subunit alpha